MMRNWFGFGVIGVMLLPIWLGNHRRIPITFYMQIKVRDPFKLGSIHIKKIIRNKRTPIFSHVNMGAINSRHYKVSGCLYDRGCNRY